MRLDSVALIWFCVRPWYPVYVSDWSSLDHKSVKGLKYSDKLGKIFRRWGNFQTRWGDLSVQQYVFNDYIYVPIDSIVTRKAFPVMKQISGGPINWGILVTGPVSMSVCRPTRKTTTDMFESRTNGADIRATTGVEEESKRLGGQVHTWL